MKHIFRRVAPILILAALVSVIGAGCTLTGATEAPPPSPAPAGGSGVTPLPPTATATKPPVIGTPTPVKTVDAFGTLTQAAKNAAANGTPTPFLPISATPSPVKTGTPGAVTGGTGSCPATYTVQSGDNLFRIAQKFNLTVAQLAAANGITNPDFVAVGTVLKIPGCGGNPPTTSGGGTGQTSGGIKPLPGDTVDKNGDILHVVKTGENLFRIALAYNLSWQVVAAYNGITDPASIVVGQVIRIPTK